MLLLNSEQWRYFPLAVQVLSTDFSKLLHGVASPPDHISILYGPAEVRFPLLKASAHLALYLELIDCGGLSGGSSALAFGQQAYLQSFDCLYPEAHHISKP